MKPVRTFAFGAALLLALPCFCCSANAAENVAGAASSCPYHPTHAVPLAMNSDDYPLLSVAQNEQGPVDLDFLILPDGSITDVKVAKSSGFARLDGAAVDVAKQRWHFDPVLANGKPISCRYAVEVAWKLEWTPWQLEQSGFTVVRLGASDYPAGHRATHEAGETLVMALVNVSGKIMQARVSRSSGFADLDAAAVDHVNSGRWQVTPAQVSGKSVTTMIGFLFVWSQ